MMHQNGGAQGTSSMPLEDLDSLMKIRRHVKRMQAGTPVLLRTLVGTKGREEFQVCSFAITEDLLKLRWQEDEGEGDAQELPLSSVVSVTEENSIPGARTEEDESHQALTLSVQGSSGGEPAPAMCLIFASDEDLESWRDGLSFLIAGSSSPPPPTPVAAVRTAPVGLSQAEQDLRQRLLQEKEKSERLQKENAALRETVKSRDTTIAELTRTLQNKHPEPSNKTASTSRESDEHLRDREATVLRQKNARLRKALRAKQQTVKELLELVGRVTSQQGAESSAVEEEEVEAGEGFDSADVVLPLRRGVAGVGRRRGGPGSASAASVSAAVGGQRAASTATSAASGATAAVAAGAVAAAAAEAAEGASDGSSEPEALKEEMRQMAGKMDHLAQQQREAAAGKAASTAERQGRTAAAQRQPQRQPQQSQQPQQPPPQTRQQPQLSPSQPRPQQQQLEGDTLSRLLGGLGGAGAGEQLQAQAPSPAAAARREAPPKSTPSVGAAYAKGTGIGSTAALKALEQELLLLEEKKRVVEKLARELEPPSDQEDDGFPLR